MPEVDIVLNALVGAAGLRATVSALSAGRTPRAREQGVAASLAGDLVMRLAEPGQLLPVDSEHSAIFQC